VKSKGLCGTVRYIGHTEFAAWELIGVQMDYSSDGFHDGRGYFDVPDGCGLFVRREDLEINAVISQYESPV
jgi:dynactin complex subunit